jgi:hypothetical protein
MLDLFGKHVEPGGQLSGITGHQIAVNNVPAIPYEAGCAHYVGDEFRINRCRELNNSVVSERLSHGPLHRPQSS